MTWSPAWRGSPPSPPRCSRPRRRRCACGEVTMPCAATWRWRRWLRGMDPSIPGQLLQVKEAITGHPQTGTCKAEMLSHPSAVPLALPKPALLGQTSLRLGGPGDVMRLTRNFAVGRDSRAPSRGYKDVRSRVLFPIHFDGWLGIGGELSIAPNDVDVSLRGYSYRVNSGMRRQLMEPGLPQWEGARKVAKNPSLLPLGLQDKHIPCSPSSHCSRRCH